jgi:hypothetical protein
VVLLALRHLLELVAMLGDEIYAAHSLEVLVWVADQSVSLHLSPQPYKATALMEVVVAHQVEVLSKLMLMLLMKKKKMLLHY